MWSSGETDAAECLAQIGRSLRANGLDASSEVAQMLAAHLGADEVAFLGGPRLDDLDAPATLPLGSWSKGTPGVAIPWTDVVATANLLDLDKPRVELIEADGSGSWMVGAMDVPTPAGRGRTVAFASWSEGVDVPRGASLSVELVLDLLVAHQRVEIGEQLLELTFDGSPTAVSVRDSNYRLVTANASWEAMYDQTVASLRGSTPSAMGAASWRDDDMLKLVIAGQLDTLRREFPLTRQDGSSFRGQVALVGSSATGDGGRATASHLLDMSEIDAAHEAVERRRQTDEMVSAFTVKLNECEDYDTGLSLAMEMVGPTIGVDALLMFEIDEDGLARVDLPTTFVDDVDASRLAGTEVRLGEVLTGKPIDEDGVASWVGKHVGAPVAVTIAELSSGERLVGAMVGVSVLPGPITAESIALQRALASMLLQFRSRLDSQEIARSVYLGAPMAISVRDANFRLVSCNAEYEALLGYSESDLLGTLPEFVAHRPDRASGEVAPVRPVRLDVGIDEVLNYRTADGGVLRCQTMIKLVPNHNQEPLIVAFLHDLTGQLEQADELRATHDRFSTVTNHLGAAVISLDRELMILYASSSANSFYPEVAAAEAPGHHLSELGLAMSDQVLTELEQVFETGERTEIEWSMGRKGSEIWVRSLCVPQFDPSGTEVTSVVSMSFDNTEQRRVKDRLAYQASHDDLTGLATRNVLVDRLQDLLLEASAPAAPALGDGMHRAALLLLDLDRFKVVNDSLGHGVGDRMLLAVADRLRLLTRSSDLVVRLGGDEFAVLMSGPVSELESISLAARLNESMRQPIDIDGRTIHTSASVGVAFPSELDQEVDELLRHADAAMYHSKDGGPNGFAVFDESLRDAVARRIQIETSLRYAVASNEMRLAFQPEVDITTGAILGAEALVRWNHPELGQLSPAEFIEIAEESGSIIELGAWVLEEACRTAGILRQRFDIPDFTIRVNLSTRQLNQPDLLALVTGVLERNSLPPDRLCLEVTETAIMRDVEDCLARLESLNAIGVRLAVDDFGTGFSSLEYLKRLPVHILKIDRAFIDGLGTDAEDTAIVNSIIRLADSLNLDVVGEGVETPAQLDELVRLGCRRAQGFLMARPRGRAELEQILKAGSISLSALGAGMGESVA